MPVDASQPPADNEMASADDKVVAFSPIEDACGNELLLRWQRRIGLASSGGFGIMRRAVVLTALAWLPLVIWALWMGRFWQESESESLLQHFAVHARFLFAIPLLIIGDLSLHDTLLKLTRRLSESGIVTAAERGRYLHIVARLAHWRNAALPHLAMIALVFTWAVLASPDPSNIDHAWAVPSDGRPGFALLWMAYVSRPIFALLILGWFWRLLLVAVLFLRIGRLDLRLSPTHPDRMGGLCFMEELPKAWVLPTLALSAVIASGWAHAILYHGATLSDFKWQAVVFVVGWTLLLLLPFAALAPVLIRTKRHALVSYGDLVRRHGQLVHLRWIEGKELQDPGLLEAPEIGGAADAAAMYNAVSALRPSVIGRRALVLILLPLILPLLAVTLLEVPLSTEIMRLFKALI